MKKTALLRKVLAEEKLLVTLGVHDALSARIMEKAGFKATFLSGFGFEASLLGKPDAGLLTMTEIVRHASNIASAVNIPVLADAEAGYGGPGNIQRTIREFEKAGVAGVFIEDQAHPVKCGSLKQYKRIISMEEMIMKVRCALDAREDPDFVICARTDSDIISLDEQIRRCNAYAQEGADFVTAIPSGREEFEAMAKGVNTPLWLYLTSQSTLTPKDLVAMGIRGIVTYPVEPLFVATKVMMDLAEELISKGTVKDTFDRLQALGYMEFFDFIGLREVVELDNRYSLEESKA